MSKYDVNIKGVDLDVYDILAAYYVTNPALQHLIKKALMPGVRGHKDSAQDYQDIIDSAYRAQQLADTPEEKQRELEGILNDLDLSQAEINFLKEKSKHE